MKHGTHSSVWARPDEKMSSEKPSWFTVSTGGRREPSQPTTGQHDVLKHSASRKRRQRDNQLP